MIKLIILDIILSLSLFLVFFLYACLLIYVLYINRDLIAKRFYENNLDVYNNVKTMPCPNRKTRIEILNELFNEEISSNNLRRINLGRFLISKIRMAEILMGIMIGSVILGMVLIYNEFKK